MRAGVGKFDDILLSVGFVLIDPRSFYGVWLVFLAALCVGRRQLGEHLLLWLPALAYALLMAASYLFSDYGAGVQEHVRFSYGRLLLQVLPFTIVFLATVLDARPAESQTTELESVNP